MRSTTLLGLLAMTALFTSAAQAIPPPWEIETMKATQSDLIVIGRIGDVGLLEGVKDADHSAAIAIEETIRGDKVSVTATAAVGNAVCKIAFCAPAKRPEGEKIDTAVVGSPGKPDVKAGDLALVFLKRGSEPGSALRVVLGAFGYIRLSAASAEDRVRVKEKLARHLEWCGRIEDAAVRTEMEAVYRKAIAFVDE
jgi:hypothetical protein